MAHLNVKLKDFVQTAPLLRLEHLFNRHVDGLRGQTGVNHDHRQDTDGRGVDLGYASVHGHGLGPHGHRVARTVVFSVHERVLNHRRRHG